MTPALPQSVGPQPNKAKFFAEGAAAFELLALFYELTVEEQEELRAYIAGLAATVTARNMKKEKR